MAQRFLILPWRERARLAEAGVYLAAAHLALGVFPFRRLASRLGAQNRQSSATPTLTDHRAEARRTGWAVTTMSRYVPWDSACLAQAVAAKWMLQKRGLASTLYLGVAFDEPSDPARAFGPKDVQSNVPTDAPRMLAHAWLRCGDVIVTGAPRHERFTVVASFA